MAVGSANSRVPGVFACMEYQEQFTDDELEKIVEEGMVYMCACPAQVAESVRKVRELYRYQRDCLSSPTNNAEVHQAIARGAVVAHSQLESTLNQVLEIERWDRATLAMPPDLRARQRKEVLDSHLP